MQKSYDFAKILLAFDLRSCNKAIFCIFFHVRYGGFKEPVMS